MTTANIVRKYNPLQPRVPGGENGGQWTAGSGGGFRDVLRLAGRIDLDPDENLLASARIDAPVGGIRMALTERNGERRLRLGLGGEAYGQADRQEGIPAWDGNPDREALSGPERRRLDLESDDLDAEYDTASESRQEQIQARLDEIRELTAVDEDDFNGTTVIDEYSMRRIVDRIRPALDEAVEQEKAENAAWDEIEALEASGDPDPVRMAQLRDVVHRQNNGYLTFSSGIIPGSKWGDVHYSVDLDEEVEVRLGVMPKGAADDWGDDKDWEGKFDAATTRKFLRQLEKMLASSETSRAYSQEQGTYKPAASSGGGAPKGGQFAVGGGRVGGKGKRPTRQRTGGGAAKPAAPAGPMSFDGSKGTGYGVKGGDPRVRTLQAALTRLGVSDSSGAALAPDGRYGPKTTSAVKKLQKRLGLEPDGKVTPELLKQITELKQLPEPTRKPRAPRKPRSSNTMSATRRSRLLSQIDRALTMGVEVRIPQLFDRAFPLDDIQILRSGDGRTVEAYAAMFDQPYEVRDQHGHYMEVIDRSAFNRTLSNGAGRQAMCLYNHGMSVVDGKPDPMAQIPIGTPLEIKADGRGLLTVTRYNKSPYADEILEAIRNGAIRSQSFRGRIVRSNPDRVPVRSRTGGLPTVTRHELGLSDYGPTPIPVNAGAAIMAVRSKTELLQDFAALDDDDRLELLRTLGVDLDGDDFEEFDASEEDDDTTTSAQSEPGSEDPPAADAVRHSGRLELQRAALRAELILKGVRRAEAA